MELQRFRHYISPRIAFPSEFRYFSLSMQNALFKNAVYSIIEASSACWLVVVGALIQILRDLDIKHRWRYLAAFLLHTRLFLSSIISLFFFFFPLYSAMNLVSYPFLGSISSPAVIFAILESREIGDEQSWSVDLGSLIILFYLLLSFLFSFRIKF